MPTASVQKLQRLGEAAPVSESPATKLRRLSEPSPDRGRFWEGGFLQKLGDLVSVGSYAMVGVMKESQRRPTVPGTALLQKPITPFEAIKAAGRGIKERAMFQDVLAEEGMKPGWARAGLGFAGDVAFDPLTYVGLGVVGKVAQRIPGATRAGRAVAAPVRAAAGLPAVQKARVAAETFVGKLPKVAREAIQRRRVGVQRWHDKIGTLEKSIEKQAAKAPDREVFKDLVQRYYDEGAEEMTKTRGALEQQAQVTRGKQPWGMTEEQFREAAFGAPKLYRSIAKRESQAASDLVYGLHERGVPTIETHQRGNAILVRIRLDDPQALAKAVRESGVGRIVDEPRWGTYTGHLEIAEADVPQFLATLRPRPGAHYDFDTLEEMQRAHRAWRRSKRPAVSDAAEGGRVAGEAAQQAVLDDVAAAGLDSDAFKALTRQIDDLDTDLARGLIRFKQMKPETLAKWEGFHLMRTYRWFDDPEEWLRFLDESNPADALRLEADLAARGSIRKPSPSMSKEGLFKTIFRRKEIPQEVREQVLGEITDVSQRLYKGMTREAEVIERARQYERMARHVAVDSHQPGYRLMRTSGAMRRAKWGALEGKWVPTPVWAALQYEDALQILGRTPSFVGKFARLLMKGVRSWKYGKAVLDVATPMRNRMSNMILMHSGGVPVDQIPVYLARGYKHVLRHSPEFRKAAMTHPAFGTSFAREELLRFGTKTGRRTLVEKGLDLPGAIFEVDEQAGKTGVYLYHRSIGKTNREAAELAAQSLFDYGEVPPVIDALRRSGVFPFVTFTYKAMPQMARWAVRKPGAMAGYSKAIRAVESLTPKEQRAEEWRALPEWQKTGGWVRIPGEDQYGRPRYWNVSWTLPWGMLGEEQDPVGWAAMQAQRGVGAGRRTLGLGGEQPPPEVEDRPWGLPLEMPGFQIGASQIMNRNPLTGAPLVSSLDRALGRTALARTSALQQALGPRLFNPPLPTPWGWTQGGSGVQALREAYAAEREGRGEEARYTVSQVVWGQIAGLKARPLDVAREMQNRGYDFERKMRELDAASRRVFRLPHLSPKWQEEMLAKIEGTRQLIIEAEERRHQ